MVLETNIEEIEIKDLKFKIWDYGAVVIQRKELSTEMLENEKYPYIWITDGHDTFIEVLLKAKKKRNVWRRKHNKK